MNKNIHGVEKKIKPNYVYRDFNRPLCIVINSYNALDPNSFAINNNVFISFHFNFSMWFRNSEIKMNRVSLLFETVQTNNQPSKPRKTFTQFSNVCVCLLVFFFLFCFVFTSHAPLLIFYIHMVRKKKKKTKKKKKQKKKHRKTNAGVGK